MDVGRVVNAPIFHVNADDPEAVMLVANIAAEWRSTWHRDVVIDLVGYRKSGHNEIDEPMFTQPIMYSIIKKHPNVLDIYSKKLISEGVATTEEVEAVVEKYDKICEEAFKKAAEETQIFNKHWLDSPWSGFFEGKDPLKVKDTGVHEETLTHIGRRFSQGPPNAPDFKIHRAMERILKARNEMVDNRQLDWAMAEAFAFGSLLKEGVHVRLSGGEGHGDGERMFLSQHLGQTVGHGRPPSAEIQRQKPQPWPSPAACCPPSRSLPSRSSPLLCGS